MIRTFTGKLVDPWKPTENDIDIRDIAHGLSNLCRYTGQCREFYSVAQHSYLVSLSTPLHCELNGLLHDAAEAYLNDLTHDVKYHDGMEAYRNAEKRLHAVIYQRFGLAMFYDTGLEQTHAEWTEREKQVLFKGEPNIFEPLLPKQAEMLFLDRFYELLDRRTLNYNPF